MNIMPSSSNDSAREVDSLLRGSFRDSNHPGEAIGGSRPEVRRARILTYVTFFVLSFLAIAFFTVTVLLSPTHTEEGADASDSSAGGRIRESQTKKHNHHGHKHLSKTFHKKKYNDVFSAAGGEDNVVELNADDGEGIAEVDLSTVGTSADDQIVVTKSRTKCDDGGYSKRTLKRAFEKPFASLFQDNRGQKKFEASDVILVNQTFAYAVCDSLWSISKFSIGLPPFSPENRQIGDPDREPDDESGYEAIFYDDGDFYVVRESVLHQSVKRKRKSGKKRDSYHAIVEQLLLDDDDYTVVEECRSEFEFEGDSKGFEGAIAVHDMDGKLTILGLCEGNHCSESRKKDKGNGVLIAMQKVYDDAEGCIWKTIRRISLPSSVNFTDYSAIAIDGQDRIAITSQEDSKLYVGKMTGKVETTGLWEIDDIAFDTKDEAVYDFPKNDNCETMYCNIEGIHWLSNNMLIAVSDKMKSKGKQDYRCFDKDQSVHAFVLP
jgi:hypothetical protein